ncbi:MAG: SusC/RagA family TonB-linked outer membrane protein [Bacteroidales bacterium]|nr:SusC/RagA family TonB-linked outer membrane protein [Bacteroidales bacterium]
MKQQTYQRRANAFLRILVLFLFIAAVQLSTAQTKNRITISLHQVSLTNLFDQVEKQSIYRFSYADLKKYDDNKIDVEAKNWTINQLMDSVLIGSKLEYTITGNNVVIRKQNLSKKRVLSGVVLDDLGEPLMGVNILVKGTAIGTISDIDGKFKLEVPATSKVAVSYLGYVTQEISAEDKSNFKITLLQDTKNLSEVVVTALGISREEKSLGYSVSKVSGKDILEVKSINAVNSLSGKVAGVDIMQSNTGVGGSSKVLIRGNSKISGSSQPLYVVDGVPIDNSNLGEADEWGGQDMGDGISSINPDDIESMSVLKGPAAAALYGSRAGNGVILITTKKWNKSSNNNFSAEFNSNMSFDKVVGQYGDIQHTYGQGIGSPPKDLVDATYMWSWGDKLNPELQFISFDGKQRDYGLKNNNMLSFFQTGSNIQNTVSFSGGNELTNFHFSAADNKMTDIVPNSNLHRNTFNVNGFMRMWKNLTLDAKVNYSIEDVNNRPFLGYSGANTALALLGLPNNIDQSWLADSRVNALGNYQYWNSQTRILNPYYVLYEMKNNSKKNRILGSVSLNYEIAKWLNLKLKSGIDSYNYDYYSYSPKTTPLAESGEMRRLFSNTSEMNSEFLLTAKKQLSEAWFVSSNIGGNIMSSSTSTDDMLGKGQVERSRIAINNYSEYTVLFSNPRKQINSLYAFANVGYKNYLFLDLTARNDWSSTLPTKNNSYFYPSVASAFSLLDAFPKLKSKILSFGKIRVSYAEVGGDTNPYNLTRSFLNYPYVFQSAFLSTESSVILPNSELKPSRNKGFEAGVDFKLFNWRLGIDASYYNQTIFDEIIKLPISSASAFDYAYINAGEINNHGIELALNITPVQTKEFAWYVKLNGAQNVNKIVRLYDNVKEQEIARASWINSYIKANEGGSYGDIVGYDFKRNEKGEVLLSSSGLPQRSDEQKVLGNGQYKITGGLTNTFTYKGLSLRVLFDFKWGAKLLSMTNMKLYQYGAEINTIQGREEWAASEEKRIAAKVTSANWVATGGYLADGVIYVGENADGTKQYKPNDVFVNPKDYWGNVANTSVLTPFVYDASYVKLREVSFSYAFSEKLMKKTKWIKNASISLTARNLYVFSHVPNIDPESTYSVSNGQGYEYGSLPQRSSFGLNVNMKF